MYLSKACNLKYQLRLFTMDSDMQIFVLANSTIRKASMFGFFDRTICGARRSCWQHLSRRSMKRRDPQARLRMWMLTVELYAATTPPDCQAVITRRNEYRNEMFQTGCTDVAMHKDTRACDTH